MSPSPPARRGKDIYCEKPLSLTIHEARAMVKAAPQVRPRLPDRLDAALLEASFCKACELVRNGRIGKVKQVIVDVGGALACRATCRRNRWSRASTGTCGSGPRPQRPYNSVLSPRGVHNHFPNWRNYREYSGGMMTDWGAHHFDIAQWGLGMDDSGPVEIIPPADPKATRGVRYLYANGVEMIHGDSGGVLFIGTEGKILVNRGKFEATPAVARRGTAPDNAIRLYKSYSHTKDFLDCMRSRKKPDLRRRDRLPLRHRLPPGQPRLLEPPPPALGPGQGEVHRRQGSQQVAGPPQARPVEGLVSSPGASRGAGGFPGKARPV